MQRVNPEPYATIHQFGPHPLTGMVEYDDDGDAIIGWYYQFHHADNSPMTELMGPYNTNTEAEAAAQKAWLNNDY